ncbi:maleylpyruvate isomerase N-terminal domain-containing protein [Streptomyces sp. NBC_00094]|uniref:maleylpyruvate isomerase N-terminal domain-containing protein n=1 Tax=Streptomyces sp. NBC_00094 TaxID=2903620 RepID=UPI0022519CA7|nr:maleylpyruvate isomerase N-terminal domain-containing protein [Streptomyces sp. NBC_00094]MCX5393806.1 maleylpyruvate isomerase N-terminal domain-containing protein [Streptomyces sp. NBC_00094]
MGTVTTFDPVIEHEKTRAALAAAVPRLVRLLRDAPDPDAPSGVPVWSVGDVGAHLAAVYLAYCAVVSADESVEWGGILPPGDLPFVERVTAMNATSVALFAGEERARLGEFVAERGEAFLRVTAGLAPDTPVTAPWYGEGATLTVAVVTGLMLSETLVHGLDIARGARLPWPIGPDEASLVIGQSMPTMMRLALDADKARGVSLAFDLVVKGGPRLAVVVDGGAMTVTRDAPPRAYDCRITVAPTTFLLVSFRRTPIWKAVAWGRMRAGGRRPWLAAQLGELVTTP